MSRETPSGPSREVMLWRLLPLRVACLAAAGLLGGQCFGMYSRKPLASIDVGDHFVPVVALLISVLAWRLPRQPLSHGWLLTLLAVPLMELVALMGIFGPAWARPWRESLCWALLVTALWQLIHCRDFLRLLRLRVGAKEGEERPRGRAEIFTRLGMLSGLLLFAGVGWAVGTQKLSFWAWLLD